jgi:hypothetical protein
MTTPSKGSLWSAIAWMGGLSLLLFWLPLIGPFIAGFVGGKKAGSVGNAALAVFLPGLLLAVLSFVLGTMLSGMPLIGILAGFGGLVLAFSSIGPLLVGALLGGFTA